MGNRNKQRSKTSRDVLRKPSGAQKLVRGFLVSNLLLLLLPTISGGVIYLMASHAMQQEVDRANLSRLRDTKTITDQQLSTMIAYVDRIAINQEVTSLSRMKTRRPSTTDILDVMASAAAFKRYNNANPLIADYYIHYDQSGITFSSRNIYLEYPRFYGTFFRWSGMDAAEWDAFASGTRHDRQFVPAADALIVDDQGDKSQRALLYLQTLPLEFHSQKDGYLAVLISESEVQRLLAGVELGETGQVLILDRQGDVMSSILSKGASADMTAHLPPLPDTDEGHLLMTYDSVEYSVSFVRSSDFGWVYLAAIPTSFVYGQLAALRLVLAFTLLGALIAGFILAIRQSSRSARPWQDIELAVGGGLAGSRPTGPVPGPAPGIGSGIGPGIGSGPPRTSGFLSELDRIRQNVLLVVQKNRDMSQVIEAQLPVIQAGFINRLLTGRISTRDQLDRELAFAGLPLEADGYLVLLVKLEYPEDASDDGLRERAVRRLVVQEQVRQRHPGQVYAADDVLEDGIAFLLLLHDEDPVGQLERLRAEMEGWQQDFRVAGRQLTRVSAGRIQSDPLDVHRSLNEARLALAFATLDRMAWYDELPSQKQFFFYPLEFENQLLHQVLAGNRAAIDQMFQRLHDENIVQQKLNPLLSGLLSSEICGTLVRVLDRAPGDTEPLLAKVQALGSRTLPEVIETARSLCLSMADRSLDARQNEDAALKDAILAYVDQAYPDAGFCMDSLRDRFPLSATFINGVFLERTGHTLSSYLESIRLERAAELLKDASQTIQAVSDAVGYTSAHSFRRAFKRRYNILPTEYQETTRKGE